MPNETRAYAQEMRARREAPRSPSNVRSHEDPTNSQLLHNSDLGVDAKIVFGRVVDCIAYAHVYKVQPERGGASVLCTLGGNAPFQVFGATELNTLSVGCGVLYWWHQQMAFGFILAVVPEYMF